MALYQGSTKQKEKSFMFSHCLEAHGGALGPDMGRDDFKLEVTGNFRDPLTNILDEACRIKALEDSSKVECLNSKSEYFQPEFIRTNYTVGMRW